MVVFSAGTAVTGFSFYLKVHQVMHNLEVIIYNLFTFTCHYQGALQSVLGFRDNLQTWLQGRLL